MKVFGMGGLFNVTQRQASGYNNAQVHVIEGMIEVRRMHENGTDIHKFMIESYSPKQVEFRAKSFVNNVGIVFSGNYVDGVIKITNDINKIMNNFQFGQTATNLMAAGAGNNVNTNVQPQYAPPVQQQYAAPTAQVSPQYAPPAQQQYAPPTQQQFTAPPVTPQYAPPVQQFTAAAPVQQAAPTFAQPSAQTTVPTAQVPQGAQEINFANMFNQQQ